MLSRDLLTWTGVLFVVIYAHLYVYEHMHVQTTGDALAWDAAGQVSCIGVFGVATNDMSRALFHDRITLSIDEHHGDAPVFVIQRAPIRYIQQYRETGPSGEDLYLGELVPDALELYVSYNAMRLGVEIYGQHPVPDSALTVIIHTGVQDVPDSIHEYSYIEDVTERLAYLTVESGAARYDLAMCFSPQAAEDKYDIIAMWRLHGQPVSANWTRFGDTVGNGMLPSAHGCANGTAPCKARVKSSSLSWKPTPENIGVWTMSRSDYEAGA